MAYKKRQHFVPKAYLKAWAPRADGKIYVYDLEKEALYLGHPDTLCYENHFYTLEELGEDRLIVDDFFTSIEGPAPSLFQALITQYLISPAQRTSVAQFLAAQMVRTRASMKYILAMNREFTLKTIEEIVADPVRAQEIVDKLQDENPDVFKGITDSPLSFIQEGLRKIQDGEWRIVDPENKRPVWVPVMFMLLRGLTARYDAATWHILHTSQSQALITNDSPVVSFTHVQQPDMPFAPGDITETVFPLGLHHAILMRYGGPAVVARADVPETRDAVRDFNRRMVMYADRYVFSHSQQLLLAEVARNRVDWLARQGSNRARGHARGIIPAVHLPSDRPPFVVRDIRLNHRRAI